MRRRLKHEWLASLSPEQRAAERQLRRRATAIACLAVIAPAVVLAACALLLSLGAGVLAVAAVTYLVLIIGNRVRHVRDERRLFAEHAERMRPQLDRVIEATNRAARHSA